MNTIMIREKNIDKVINCFLNQEVLTQNEVATMSGLSVPSVGKILKGLLYHQLLTEIEIGESSGGRKPKRYTLSEEKWAVGVIYIEKRESTLYVLTPFNRELYRTKVKSEIVDNVSFEQVLKELLEEAKKELTYFYDITSWGIIVPGIVDLENNTIIYSKPLGVKNFFIEPMLSIKENEISVYLFRDADAYLLSNNMTSIEERAAHIYVNDGVGFSMIKENQLLKNTVGSLELGHTVFCCSDGKYKKIGEVFSKRNLSSSLNLTEDEARDFSLKSLGELAKKNNVSLKIYNEQIQALNILMINVMNLFNPSTIYISGKYINDFNLDELIGNLEKDVLEPFFKNIVIKHTESDVFKALRGVVRYINKKNVE